MSRRIWRVVRTVAIGESLWSWTKAQTVALNGLGTVLVARPKGSCASYRP